MKNLLLKLFGSVVVACIASFVLLATPAHAADTNVAVNATNFPDANFRSWISDKYDKDNSGYLDDTSLTATSLVVPPLNITDMTGIRHFPKLYQLQCPDNQLTFLDLSHNPELYQVFCDNNQLTSLNTTGCIGMKQLFAYSNNLTSLDLSTNVLLLELYVSDNQLTSLDLSHNPFLENLNCEDNQLTSLDFSNNPVLQWVDCYNNQISTLNISRNHNLRSLYCYNNRLTSLYIGNDKPVFGGVVCDGNQIYDIAPVAAPSGSYFYATNNQAVIVPAIADAANPGAYISSGIYPLGAGHSIVLGTGASYSVSTGKFKAAALDTPYTFTTTTAVGTVSGTITLTTAAATHTVTFVDWDGTVLYSQVVTVGNSAVVPANPSRSGYQFTGWSKSLSNINSNLTVTALYQPNSTVPPAGMLQGASGSIGTALGGGLVLDVKGGSSEPGAPITIWNGHGLANQQFSLVPDGNGYYWIVNLASNMALDVKGGSSAHGTPIVQWPRHNGDNQKWTLLGVGRGEFIIVSKMGLNNVIDVSGARRVPGTELVLWGNYYAVDQYAANQHFKLNAAQPAAAAAAAPQGAVLRSPLRVGGANLVADIHSSSQGSGAAAIVWTSTGGQNQKFKLVFDPATGYYSIQTFGGTISKVLDVSGGRPGQGTPVIQWGSHGGLNQRWYIEDAGGGLVYIHSAINGYALDINNSGGVGSQLIVWPFHGGNNQKWAIIAS